MRISELMELLGQAQGEHGDLNVLLLENKRQRNEKIFRPCENVIYVVGEDVEIVTGIVLTV